MTTINNTRRRLLKSASMLSVIALIPNVVLAAWPKNAFKSEGVSGAIKNLWGIEASADNEGVKLKAPDIAENGAVVPISVSSDIKGVDNIAIFVEGNPNPLAASFDMSEFTLADISTRIKMGKTSNVIAAVHANGKVYTARQEVKVTIGGCGG